MDSNSNTGADRTAPQLRRGWLRLAALAARLNSNPGASHCADKESHLPAFLVPGEQVSRASRRTQPWGVQDFREHLYGPLSEK